MTKQDIKNKIFAKRLKQLMEENNETIYTIADIIDLSPSTISRYINGQMTPKITTIKVLAQQFSINPVWLMGYDVNKNIDSKQQTENKPNTIAAHLEGKNLTKQEKEEIKDYVDYLLSKRNN